ncbi:DUF523 and DUF1722 domain-containing protein [Evansella sp. LMS18]|uniref:YbgA family protein n=1 Tax=Evansella sp. LMS18 TaxID=2924033 RepID=UPI0020D0BE40|nr:DUF523 and DUF1722 domain-containing protein [Evansella sp. LMS18]UTR10780.1 DUF523 and DUF1722 domain-containing protein [Evansella sp. LMS18]
MDNFEKPIVVVSKCLGFDSCRFNGDIINDKFTEKLAPFVNYVTVCPEVEIGLGTPRKPIRIVSAGEGELRLVQPEEDRDISDKMNDFSNVFLDSLGEVDGFILKNRSPSCGISDAKVMKGAERGPTIGKSAGFFGSAVNRKYSHLAIEDEGRLRNFQIREHFLIKLFTLSRFRQIKKSSSFKALLDFHTKNKYLFMAYDQVKLKQLGRIIANNKKGEPLQVYESYEKVLYELLEEPPGFTSKINVLHHIMGYFSKELTTEEKAFFLGLVEQYRENQVPLSSPAGVLRAWIVRFQNVYLRAQTFFYPYPDQLIDITDSGKGRNYA